MAAHLESHSDGSVTVRGLKGWDGWLFTVRMAVAAGSLSVLGVDVRAPEGVGIRPESWRRLPIGAVLNAARGPQENAFIRLLTLELGEATPRPYGGSKEHDDQVVRLYRAALDQGLSPREVIRVHFDINEKTAQRWIADLRRSPSRPDRPLGTYAEERDRASRELPSSKSMPRASSTRVNRSTKAAEEVL